MTEFKNGIDKESIARDVLSSITIFTKYAKYNKQLKRRETWDELVSRNKNMHIKKFPRV